MLLGIQVIGVLFALFMLYMTFLYKKRKEFTKKEFYFWIITWIAFIFLVLFPHAFDFIIKDVLSFSRTLDFFIVSGFMFIIGVVFYTYTVTAKTHKKVDKIVRKIAIDKAYKGKK